MIKFTSPLFVFGIAVIIISTCPLLFVETCKTVKVTVKDKCDIDRDWEIIYHDNCAPPHIIPYTGSESDPGGRYDRGPEISYPRTMEKCSSVWSDFEDLIE